MVQSRAVQRKKLQIPEKSRKSPRQNKTLQKAKLYK